MSKPFSVYPPVPHPGRLLAEQERLARLFDEDQPPKAVPPKNESRDHDEFNLRPAKSADYRA